MTVMEEELKTEMEELKVKKDAFKKNCEDLEVRFNDTRPWSLTGDNSLIDKVGIYLSDVPCFSHTIWLRLER